MTPKQYAMYILEDVSHKDEITELAQAYLALESRIQKLEAVAEALRWYASEFKPGEFSIVDANRAFISDMSAWGERARKALAELERE